MWLLNYLLGISSRVITLFSSYYFRVIDAARFAFSRAVDQANKALSKAKSFALDLWRNVRAYARSLVNAAKAVAVILFNSAKSFAVGLFNTVKAFATVLFNVAKSFAVGLFNAAKVFILTNVAALKAFLTVLIDAAIRNLFGLISSWPPLEPFVKRLKVFFSEENLKKLEVSLKEDFDTLHLFVSNPVGFLVAFWRTFMLTFLDFALGYALGTTNRELPPWPSFGNGSGGPFPSPGPGPGPTPNGLVAPLSKLRISGHRFTPGHLGVDLGCTQQDTIFAMHDGVIETSGFSRAGYGFNVTIRGGPWWTRYAHLKAEGLRALGKVSAGQVIAICDDSGNSSGNHLHLEIKRNGRFVDPVPLLGLT